MKEDLKSSDGADRDIKGALFDSIYGSMEDLREGLRKGMINEMRSNLISVLGLVSFKLVTQLYARRGSAYIEDPSERLYKARSIKEGIRNKVIDEWKAVSIREAKRSARAHMEPEFSAAFPEEILDEVVVDALKEIDMWVRQALDMTPTPQDLFDSLNIDIEKEFQPDED